MDELLKIRVWKQSRGRKYVAAISAPSEPRFGFSKTDDSIPDAIRAVAAEFEKRLIYAPGRPGRPRLRLGVAAVKRLAAE